MQHHLFSQCPFDKGLSYYPLLSESFFALIGQMTQSVVIGLLYSDWSDDPVCLDWSTLL